MSLLRCLVPFPLSLFLAVLDKNHKRNISNAFSSPTRKGENLMAAPTPHDTETVKEKLEQAELYHCWLVEQEEKVRSRLAKVKHTLQLAPGHALYVQEFAELVGRQTAVRTQLKETMATVQKLQKELS